ncbi:MAG: formylmethanofuran dehydrogenase subunit A [alpha proteobacterium MED-G10]|nr:MAG: formylmethanofuran dehydrogenase subunit A [alpha proteobacterium MED-G10]|tara:strand:+ start:2759 stop:4399 length:1641 start_codon:yes stop_codon:yes gene_type:complete
MKFKIINGKVFDPTQNLNGNKTDIYVDNGIIVKPNPSEFYKFKTVYDATDLIVMAGAIDIHSHIAGGNVNNARLLSPEIHSNFLKQNLNRKKNLPGFNSRWTSDGTGYRYAEMGFTTVVEPAVLPINSFLTHLELEKIPMIDKAGLAILGNDSFLLESMHKKKGQNFLNDYVAYTLNSTKCLGLKVINAGGAEFFKKGGETFDLDDVVPSYGVTSRQILTALNKANEDLKIKHPLHVHCNNLGVPGNIKTILETIKTAEGRRMHLAHVQFYGYDNEGKRGFSSGSVQLADAVNKNKNITVDVGQVMFKPTVTISSDILRQYEARNNANPKKWIINEVEDGGGGIVPYEYKSKNFVNSLQWLIGLEIFLMIKDPSKVFFTTDHPNGAPFTSYPELFRLLMDYEFRLEKISKINQESLKFSFLKDIKRTYSMYDIAIMTRSSPAKILGLKDRGSLRDGCIADISVYDPKKKIDQMFQSAKYVFKNGNEIVRNGKILKYHKSSTIAVDIRYERSITKDLQSWVNRFYSLDVDDFKVNTDFFRNSNFKYC